MGKRPTHFDGSVRKVAVPKKEKKKKKKKNEAVTGYKLQYINVLVEKRKDTELYLIASPVTEPSKSVGTDGGCGSIFKSCLAFRLIRRCSGPKRVKHNLKDLDPIFSILHRTRTTIWSLISQRLMFWTEKMPRRKVNQPRQSTWVGSGDGARLQSER